MKQVLFATILLAVLSGIASAQTQSRQRSSSDQANTTESAVRSRTVGPRVANHAEKPQTTPVVVADASVSRTPPAASQPVWGNTAINGKDTSAVAGAANESSSAPAAPVTPTVVQSTILPLNPPAANNASPAGVAARPTAAPSAYAVGVGDVLDIRLSNTPARESTLFTVLKNGTIEYPLLASPLSVVGMATDEIARALSAEIKVIKTPKVSVSVRDYASHTILVTGLVDNPGRKILRRESMPLFAIMAEASVRAEATTLTVTHNGKEGAAISLQDQQAMSALVASGDVIKVSGNSTASGQFVYVGGDVAAPGEKTFRQGMTLTQVIIAAGTNPNAIKAVKIAKRSRDGLLVTSEYNLKSIQQGKSPDPLVEAGDRLEVTRD